MACEGAGPSEVQRADLPALTTPAPVVSAGVNDFTASKLLGKPTVELKKKDGGNVWEKVLDANRKTK